jgi:hypothetical protein
MTDIIPRPHVFRTCQIGQGPACCRYLLGGPDGFECAKHTSSKGVLDRRAAKGELYAQADNCSGNPEDWKELDS